MSIENIELSDDEISKALNKRLEEDSREEKLDAEVSKRMEVINKDKEKKKEELRVREATFTDEGSKKKKIVKGKDTVTCASCGSEDMDKISNDDDTFIYKGQNVSAVYICNKCRKRSGVV